MVEVIFVLRSNPGFVRVYQSSHASRCNRARKAHQPLPVAPPTRSQGSLVIFDLIIGFSLINIFVYLSFIVIVLVGNHFKKIKLKSVLISSIVFFIISNFGVWLIGYPKTVSGIVMCYTAAIPFFINTILGDLFYSFLLKYTLNTSLKLNIIKTNH